MSVITLSACCENLIFGIDTDVVTTLPEPGKYTCIETDIYSGCAQVIDVIFSGSASTFISNYGSYESCDECQEVCACEPCCFDCREYEITNPTDQTEEVFWTDCNGYLRTFNLPTSMTINVCACEDSVGPITMSISSPGNCTKNCDETECDEPPCGCYEFSGITGSEGATIVYTDCFSGLTGNTEITLVFTGTTIFTFCACADGNTDPNDFVVGGTGVTWSDEVILCPCEPPPPSTTAYETPTITPTPSPSPNPSITPS
jgi:hypothetical protein